jgi:hypothetical protein
MMARATMEVMMMSQIGHPAAFDDRQHVRIAPSEKRWHFSPRSLIPQGLAAGRPTGHKRPAEAVEADWKSAFAWGQDPGAKCRFLASTACRFITERVDNPVDEIPAPFPSGVAQRLFFVCSVFERWRFIVFHQWLTFSLPLAPDARAQGRCPAYETGAGRWIVEIALSLGEMRLSSVLRAPSCLPTPCPHQVLRAGQGLLAYDRSLPCSCPSYLPLPSPCPS